MQVHAPVAEDAVRVVPEVAEGGPAVVAHAEAVRVEGHLGRGPEPHVPVEPGRRIGVGRVADPRRRARCCSSRCARRSPCRAAPERTICTACWKCAFERCQRPTCTTRWCWRAAATIALPSSTVIATGFSTNTSLPAWHAITVGSACQWSGVATITMSIVLSSRTRRKSLCDGGGLAGLGLALREVRLVHVAHRRDLGAVLLERLHVRERLAAGADRAYAHAVVGAEHVPGQRPRERQAERGAGAGGALHEGSTVYGPCHLVLLARARYRRARRRSTRPGHGRGSSACTARRTAGQAALAGSTSSKWPTPSTTSSATGSPARVAAAA